MPSHRFGARLFGALTLFAALAAPALAAAPGTALGVAQDATIEMTTGNRTVTVGTDIFIGDTVSTGPTGQVQILFSDKTELVVGPSSRLKIEDYLVRGDASAGKLAIDALAGTFRFATGGAAKNRYQINTPGGTIGVRGTGFDFIVAGQQTQVLLYHGAVVLCNLSDTCVTLDGTCELGQYDLSESRVIGSSKDLKGPEREALRAAFRYAQSQSPLLRQFWFDGARECFNRKVVNDVPDALVTGDGKTQVVDQPPPNGEPDDPDDPDDPDNPNDPDNPDDPGEGCWYVDGELFCL